MKRIVNFRDFNVFTIEKEVWDVEYHNHNFYELIVIESGKGKHRLNDVTFPYKKGDVFLLQPSDHHEFIISRKTRFIYIKFSDHYISTYLLPGKSKNMKETIQLLLTGRSVKYESAVADSEDQKHFIRLAYHMQYEFSTKKVHSEDMVTGLFSAMITLLCRNLIHDPAATTWKNTELSKIDRILAYISIYALDETKMRIESMAEEFLLSPNYISIYVKSKTGFSIQQHVIQYKMKTAEKLLSHSDYTINEIAEKLNFTDASHFNKLFTKYKNTSPSKYKAEQKG
ncbi:AraC family transcriptional regulator [Chryseobacterium kwangjuense]|uniref:HTH araC/xylS-type domain-containing protein n=1 Tax=Chryseobacterium kwangjuense TaxID=267125 RepID=A0A135WJJ6_9FLAO|nr:helix-turn-helix domain-containing protein [Chryseobacterium kwangjuense]KXH85079.1 hypothetical protein AU378_04810 [Chryseobacterium kwangjuense]